MNNTYFLAFAGFFVCFLISRMISTTATRKLDTDSRHRIFDEFTPKSNLKNSLVVGFGLAYLAVIFYLPGFVRISSIIFFTVFSIYFVINIFRMRQRLSRVDAPRDYVRSITLSWVMFIIGFAMLASAGVIDWR